jgi:4-carboxymuconolactone decarboxylase
VADVSLKQNAVLGDPELQEGLKALDKRWGELCIRVTGEVWGLPLIDQKTKALITIAVDVVNANETGPGTPFGVHVGMALKQGATFAELEELLMFMSVYAGFNKAAGALGRLNEIKAQYGDSGVQ